MNSLQGQTANDILLHKPLRALNQFQQKVYVTQDSFKSDASYQQDKSTMIPQVLSGCETTPDDFSTIL